MRQIARSFVAFAFGAAALGLRPCAVDAAERVQFESARYQVGPLQKRLALARGEPMYRPAADTVIGYLTKPAGDGPFPAIVHLHGCSGLPGAVKTGGPHFWSERLASWGYAVLVVDSFTSRGIDNTCAGRVAPRVADAIGARAYLARQPFVDPDRIGVIGFSAGGIAALSLAEAHEFELFEDEAVHRFKAAVAYYPPCAAGDLMKIPTLILIGELDDWTPASSCRHMAARQAADSPLTLVVYPGAYHVFEAPVPPRRYFGHWLEYNAAAADAAAEQVRQFLATHLAR
jgi:dienelactone hydrolase